jgi:hypothetical protein
MLMLHDIWPRVGSGWDQDRAARLFVELQAIRAAKS